MTTAFIPAKSSSSRIPNKNMISLGGKPLIAWTLEACIRWGKIDEIVVATDCSEIAYYATSWGAKVYPLEDKDSNDKRTVMQLWKEFCKTQIGTQVLFHLTSPFRKIKELNAAWDLFQSGNHDIIISVQEERRVKLDHNGKPTVSIEERMTGLSQNRTPGFYLDGSFYIADAKYAATCLYPEEGRVGLFPISTIGTIDINTLEDLEIARLIMSGIKNMWWNYSLQ